MQNERAVKYSTYLPTYTGQQVAASWYLVDAISSLDACNSSSTLVVPAEGKKTVHGRETMGLYFPLFSMMT